MLSLVTPAYLRLGTTFASEDPPLTKLIRISMITQACSQEYKPCVKQAQSLFDQWMESPDPLRFTGYSLFSVA